MRVSELRIGNLVNGIYADNYGHLKIDEKETICKVTTLDISDLSDYPIYVESDEGIEHFDEFEGIPITEEWLFKFGFHLRDGFSNTFKLNLEKHQYDCSEITYSEKEGLLRFSNGKEKGTTLIPHIKHVHQLQNLYFALTGEELTIKQQEQ
jgi:hypothetical protein